MKIIIHSLDELLQLSELVTYGKMPREVVQLLPDPAQTVKLRAMLAERQVRDVDAGGDMAWMRTQMDQRMSQAVEAAEPNGLPADIAQPEGLPADIAELPARDADGAQYDTRWHSEPMKLTDKGVFRARRGRDNDAYKAWLLEQAIAVAEAAWTDEAEPVATETHALPQDEDSREAGADYAGEGGQPHPGFGHAEPGDTYESAPQEEPQAPASAVDLETLIAASLEAAQDASDSHVDLLNACRDFTSKHGHTAFTALKVAVAPDDAYLGGGKSVQHFTPGERRLMQACIANYPSN